MHVDAGQVDRVGIDRAGLDDLLDLDDRDLAGHRHRRIEVARGAAKDEVAGLVGALRLDQRDLGQQGALHDVGVAVELARLLALGDQRADAGAGEERGDAGAAGTELLGQRALRRELELELAGQVLALELLVLADVARDHLLDLARLEQLAEAEAVDAGVVRDDGQVLDARIAQRLDQGLGNAAQAEAADGHQLAVANDAGQGGGRARKDLVHRRFLESNRRDYQRAALPRMAAGRNNDDDGRSRVAGDAREAGRRVHEAARPARRDRRAGRGDAHACRSRRSSSTAAASSAGRRSWRRPIRRCCWR